jgi:serine/threonine protein kinase
MHRIGDIIDQRYLLTRPLGMRQEAEMWEAEHRTSGRKLTLKVVAEETGGVAAARSRFTAEARLAAEIGHPGVVDVFDVGTSDGAAYLVMELLRGETLADIVTHQGAMQAEDACHVMLQVLGALEAAHAVGIAHGDLRSESVLLRRGRDGRLIVKLLDFGNPGRSGPSSEAPASAARAASGFDPRDDIQAAGTILYDMLTGRIGMRQGARAQGSGSIPPPESAQALVPAIPAGLARVVDSAISPGSGGRTIGSARELVGLLAPFAISEQAPSLAPRDTLMPFLSPEARRSRGMARLERAVLGIAEPKEKTSVRPNLVLIEGAQEMVVNGRAFDSAKRGASDAPRALPAHDLLSPRIPRPPRTPEIADPRPRVSRGNSRAESGNRGRKRNSMGHRRWRASRHSIGTRTSDLSSLQAAAMNRVMRRIWSAGLLAAAGMGAGLLLGHLLHF